jgi:hypothetical protein
MTADAGHLEHARKVADAILYEGYLLYPYRQSSQKNKSRFQFGVLMPSAYGAIDPTELSASQTQCLVECGDDSRVQVLIRFLQLQSRRVEEATGSGALREVPSLTVDGIEHTCWDEAVERDEHVAVSVGDLAGDDSGEFAMPFRFGPQRTAADVLDSTGRVAGRLTRSMAAIYGIIKISGERVAGPYRALRLTVRLENLTVPATPLRNRDEALAHALVAAHALIRVPGGMFISMTDPPEWASGEVAACVNIGTWPVLAGPPDCRDLVLSSPIILYDHAEVAPESAGDLFDATEIDEILTLRTLALTDAEKQAARATDPRASELMDRLEGMPPEMFDRLHGAIRYLNATPWWDPGSDSSVSPETDHVVVGGVPVARGSKVIMRPGTRRADAQDLFLAGRRATVEAVLYDVDDNVHVAVTPDDDPAADLQRSHGRFLYFATDEIEAIEHASNDETGREDFSVHRDRESRVTWPWSALPTDQQFLAEAGPLGPNNE